MPPDNFIAALLVENTDPNGKHLEYRDMEGTVFARMAKVYRKGGLFNLFPKDNHVHAELRNAEDELLLTTISYRGDTPRERKVEINTLSGIVLANLYDAPFGADFEAADGTVLGMARRPEDSRSTQKEVAYIYTDASGEVVGTCERRYPNQSDSLLDFLSGTSLWGMSVEVLALDSDLDPLLQTMLFLFPALQYLRFSRNG